MWFIVKMMFGVFSFIFYNIRFIENRYKLANNLSYSSTTELPCANYTLERTSTLSVLYPSVARTSSKLNQYNLKWEHPSFWILKSHSGIKIFSQIPVIYYPETCNLSPRYLYSISLIPVIYPPIPVIYPPDTCKLSPDTCNLSSRHL